ncbi:hypothetical protein WHI96_23640 [Pseudonocardia tropica]|uniref:Uncharacterized protein n=1 Tax=Pseudonocardia tropica TaxID=681289 RepID=A0ABV1K0R7_9PSEU
MTASLPRAPGRSRPGRSGTRNRAAATHADATVALLETVHHAVAAAGEEGYRDVLADRRSAPADPT